MLAEQLRHADGATVRLAIRDGRCTHPTAGLALGYVQANLVVVPSALAFEFLLFCQRNPKPCPVLDVTDVGNPCPQWTAPGADVRTDIPKYLVWRNGVVDRELDNITELWNEDSVAFLLGCSFTFEHALLQANIPVRHLEAGCNVPMYRTNLKCIPAGRFRGNMVVSMRPMTPADAIRSVGICSRFPRAHGAPVHIGNPDQIGIQKINDPDFGDPVEIRAGEIPVFWACGVTPQAVVMQIKPPLVITHKPGHMFITDLRDVDLQGE